MTEYVRVNACGRVTLAEERFSAAGRGFARLCVATGGDARKAEAVAQFDFYDEEARALALRCKRGERVLVLGRLQGGFSDRGYWNAYLFGDAVFRAEGDGSACLPAGGAKVPRSESGAAMPYEEEEDIPF